MNNIENIIERLGYKRKEAQLYLAALVLGESKVCDLAEKLKIPRTSALAIAKKLQKVGLMNYYDKRSHRFWVAENPEKLLTKLKAEEATLQGALPQLKLMQKSGTNLVSNSRTYTGQKEIGFLFDDILMTKNNFKCMVAWNDMVTAFGKDHVDDFIEKQSKSFLKMQLICPRNETTMHLKENDRKQFRDTRFFREGMTLDTATFIYGNKVGIISLNSAFPTGFLIEDSHISHAMNVFFEELWHHTS